MSFSKVPYFSSAIHKAALHINKVGPLTRAALFEAVNFGLKSDHNKKLEHAFEIGWLCLTATDLVDLTESTRRHFAGGPPKEKYVGQPTPPAHRPNVFATTLNKKHLPNSRGPRADVPEWSRRSADVTFKSVGDA